MVATPGHGVFGVDTRLDLAGYQNFCRGHHVSLGEGYFPAFSIRPNHASGLENFHSRDLGLVGGDWHMDANSMEYLELMQTK